MTELSATVAKVAGALGPVHVAALAAAYRSAGGYSAAGAARARSAIPAPHGSAVDRLNRAWSMVGSLDGAAIALALESAQASAQRVDAPKIDVVVTGPDSPAAPVRLTSEVVRQMIDQAKTRVMLVSFAAYQMASILAALDAAITRGVSVALILESADHLEGGGGVHAYAKYRMYHWPSDQREPPTAKLHAKAVIVDGHSILLTSANLTNAAYDSNIELGVLCRGGDVALRVQRHFDALINGGVLRPVAMP